jgi:hypothetical protein
MVMDESGEGAANHGVLKVKWPLELCDSAGEFLRHAEMPAAPRDFVTKHEEAARLAIDCAFTGAAGGRRMRLNRPSQVEAAIEWRGNVSLDPERLHPLSG